MLKVMMGGHAFNFNKITKLTFAFVVIWGLFLVSIKSAHAATDCTNTGVTGVPQTECEALVALYTSTTGDGWTNNTNWNTWGDCY